jgi:hypothetical protein
MGSGLSPASRSWGPHRSEGSENMNRATLVVWAIASLLVSDRVVSAADYAVTEKDDQINIVTPDLEAAVRKKGYVSGVAAQSFLDKKTGLRDAGFGLDIVDWIMEPGSDEAYRSQLHRELVYPFGNLFHGKQPKRSIEGPQICTQARELKPELIRGADFVAVRQQFQYRWASGTSCRWTGSTR